MKKRSNQPEQLEKLMQERGRKFVRLEEGAQFYSLGKNTFRELAKDAGAVYKLKRIVLVNLDLIDEYLENFREED